MIVPPHVLAAIRQPAFVYRREGIVDAANDRAEDWAGGPLAGMTLADMIACLSVRHRDGRLILPSGLPAARALRGEEVLDVPLTVTTADSRPTHVLATASPIMDGDTVTGALECWQDATAQVRAEEALAAQLGAQARQNEQLQVQQEELRIQSEELQCQADELRESGDALRTSLERLAFGQRAARTGFWDWDMTTDRLEWSPGFYDLFGLDPSAPASFETWHGALHPQDREEAMATIDRAVRERSRLENEYRILLPDGTVRWIGAIGDTTYDADGRPVRMAGICVDITERVLADEALRRAQRHYQALLEHSLLSYARCRTLFDDAGVPNDYEFVEVNEAYLAMTGFSDIVGRRITEVVPGMERDLIDFHNEVALSGIPRPADVYSAPLARWYQVNVYSPVPGEFVALSRDISARKRMEAALTESEARFRLALSNAPTAVFHQDADLRYTWYSNPHPPFSNRDLLGKTDADVMSPEDAGSIAALKREVLETGEGRRGEVSVTADGATTYYDLAVEPVTDAEGQTIGVMGVSHDITELKRVEEALRESEERLRLAQEGSQTGVWDWDVRTGRQTYSGEISRLYGVEGEALEEVDLWRRYVHPDDLARVERERDAALARSGAFAVEFRVVRPSGEVRWLAGTGRGYRDDQGALVRVVGTNRDITERKEAEADVARYAERLQRSNEELQRFAYVASHDLQEPLRSIVSFSQLLERRYKGKLDTDADEFIAFIVEGGNRMQRLIADLLQVSRVETGAKPLEPTDAAGVVSSALRALETPIREAGAAVEVGPMPRVLADAAQLEQVFANLVSNAIKYRHADRAPAIAISAERTNGTVEFAVQDNGIGIDHEYHDRIFEMFRRLHTHDQYEGTGIGLAVVKRIVERHGGTIWVESTPGEGSTFFFTLPAA